MSDCIFCKIVTGEIPSVKIWEDDKHLAILDLNPNTRGMTLVLTKNHYPSYAMDMPNEAYQDFFAAAKIAAKFLEQGLPVQRVALVMEGLGINHAHLKLYPLHGLTEKFQESWAKEKVFFENYSGYISTQLGPEIPTEELQKVAQEIIAKNKNYEQRN